MSADNTIFVQKNNAGQFVFQHGFKSEDELPNPELSTSDNTFDDLQAGIAAFQEQANETEYGFTFVMTHADLVGGKPAKADHVANRERKIEAIEARIVRQRGHIASIEKNIGEELKEIERLRGLNDRDRARRERKAAEAA